MSFDMKEWDPISASDIAQEMQKYASEHAGVLEAASDLIIGWPSTERDIAAASMENDLSQS